MNPSAARRLARALLKHHPIPTNEVASFAGVKHRVYLVHTKDIHRTDWRYVNSYKRPQHDLAWAKKNIPPERFEYEWGESRDHTIHNVNQMRKSLRAGKKLPPVYLTPAHGRSYAHRIGKKWVLTDGHHRLTAHQAEGKKFIRAIINPDTRFLDHFPNAPED